MENEILEQHEHTRRVREARIILRARRDFRLFFLKRSDRSKSMALDENPLDLQGLGPGLNQAMKVAVMIPGVAVVKRA
jgi:hypothetical protein